MSIKNGSNFWKKNSKSISRITHKNLRNSRTFIKLRKLNNLLKFLKIIRKPDRRSSKIYENREKPMKIVKNLWKSYKSYHHQKFMKIYENREKAVKIVKNLKIAKNLWNPSKSRKLPPFLEKGTRTISRYLWSKFFFFNPSFAILFILPKNCQTGIKWEYFPPIRNGRVIFIWRFLTAGSTRNHFPDFSRWTQK